MNRHHVHLSGNIETAISVRRRRGKPIVLIIHAQEMHWQGFIFFKSDNNVWLTDVVPARFIKQTSLPALKMILKPPIRLK